MADEGMPNGHSYELVAVPLDQIEIDADNVRTRYDQTHIENLREALVTALGRGEEYINAPVVYRVGRGRFRVKHGNCRLLAARGVVERLHVRVADAPNTPSEKVLDQLGENLLQGGLGPLDTSQALRRLQLAGNLSIGELGSALKERGIERSTAWVRMYLGLATVHPEVQDALEKRRVSPTAAWALHGLSGPQQQQLVRRIIDEGLGVEGVRRAVAVLTGSLPEIDGEDQVSEVSWTASEFGLAQLQEEIARAASLAEGSAPAPRRMPDAEHRDGLIAKRWELLPVPLQARDIQRSKVDQSALEERVQGLRPNDAGLAREAAVLGGYSVVDAARLAQQAGGEVEEAPAPIGAALNALRLLIENSTWIPKKSAAAAFLTIRMRRVLENLE